MISKTKTTVLVLCLITLMSIPIYCESDDKSTCGNSKTETIVWGGPVHYEVSQFYPQVSEDTIVANTDYIRSFHFDVYAQRFIHYLYDRVSDYRSQAGFYLPRCDEDKKEDEKHADCQYINKFINGIKDYKDDIFVLRFGYSIKDNEYKRVSTYNSEQQFWEVTQPYPVYYSQFAPEEWFEERPDETIMGACAYSERQRMFIYVINGKDDTKNAVVYTRTLKDIREGKKWTTHDVPNTAGIKFISLFYWFLDGKVLAQVLETKNTPRSLGHIYEYSPNDPKVFVLKSKNIKEYLWKCSQPTTDYRDMFVVIAMIITVVLLLATLLIVLYFVFFIFIRKRADPIFGLRQKIVK